MADNNINNNNGAGEGTEPKTYTQEEVDALLQQEGDRRVSMALKKADIKNAEKIKEAEKLAAMNEQEKYAYQLEQREAALAEKERELALMENKNEASKILAEKGISIQLVDLIVADDAETMKENINLLEKAFKNAVKEAVEKRLGTEAPAKSSSSSAGKPMNQMSMAELTKLYAENPEMFNN